ncbi:MAG: hypothetical protein ACQEXE_09550 [Bacillota bacterium]|uniref:hypothetical protein n=1 Tax=Bacillaceae TaxID=186817 RepID=UPI0013D08974|nr:MULTISPECIES: hypothetical protein [Bacillaceae]MCS0654334.1 hypothetical protein [Cytobacillus firmus]MCU1805475.1 hypothetical protein [Cytobacillus firmus]
MFIIRKKQLVLHHVFLSGTRSFIDRSVYSGGRPNSYEEGDKRVMNRIQSGKYKLSYPSCRKARCKI